MKMTAHTRRGMLFMLLMTLIAMVALTLPHALNLTWAALDDYDHQLTYRRNELTWDSATGIDPDTGAARLTLFRAHYENVDSAEGKVFAPGTSGHNTVRLRNTVKGGVKYTAVLYRIDDSGTVPVEPQLTCVSRNRDTYKAVDPAKLRLPDRLKDVDVISAVTGTVSANSTVDFDVDWLWRYEVDAAQDAADTGLGNERELKNITLGLYIVVEDSNHYDSDRHYPAKPSGGGETPTVVEPTVNAPKTGDTFSAGAWLAVMTAAACGAAAVGVYLRRQRKDQQAAQ